MGWSLKKWTRLITVGLCSLIVFLIVTVLVFSKLTQTVDQQSAILVYNTNLGPAGTWVLVLFTDYGREVVWSLVVLTMLLLGGKATKLLAIELAALLIAGIVIGDVTKIVIMRQRPFETVSGIVPRVPAEYDYSYPSGHALIVSIGAAFCLAKFRRKVVAGLLALEAGIVCYSRIYVGVHYPLDVVGGVFLGTAIALLGVSLFEKYLVRYLEELSEFAVRILRDGPLNL